MTAYIYPISDRTRNEVSKLWKDIIIKGEIINTDLPWDNNTSYLVETVRDTIRQIIEELATNISYSEDKNITINDLLIMIESYELIYHAVQSSCEGIELSDIPKGKFFNSVYKYAEHPNVDLIDSITLALIDWINEIDIYHVARNILDDSKKWDVVPDGYVAINPALTTYILTSEAA